MDRSWYNWKLLVQVITLLLAFVSSADGRELHPTLQTRVTEFTTTSTTNANWTAPPNSFADAPLHSHDSETPPMQAGLSSPTMEPTFQTLPVSAFRPYPPIRALPPLPFALAPRPLILPCPRGYFPPPRDVGPGGTLARNSLSAAAAAIATASRPKLYHHDMRYYPLFPSPYSTRCYEFPPRTIRPLPSPRPRKRLPP